MLASCPSAIGEFRIWAWSSKSEKLGSFREEKAEITTDSPFSNGSLHWSRNGKVVQFIEGYELRFSIANEKGGANMGCQEVANTK